MKILKELELDINNQTKIIYFGQPDNQIEKEEMFKLRYRVYSERGYIDASKYHNELEIDEYDMKNKCQYFIATLDKKIIGTIRLITDKKLPTELNFSFSEPIEITKIPKVNRGELGRLIIIPPDREGGIFLPRGLLMLFMIITLVDYGKSINIIGGYSFIKNKLKDKMIKLKLPIRLIEKYELKIEENDVLYRYFTQQKDPVIPVFFLTEEFNIYIKRIISNHWLFTNKGKRIILNNNIYSKFLRKFNLL